MIYLYISFILITIAIYSFLCFIFKAPQKVKIKLNSKTKTVDIVEVLTNNISNKIKLSDYRKQELQEKIAICNLDVLPERFIAECITRFIIYIPIAILMYFLFSPAAFVVIFLGFRDAFNHYNSLNKIINSKKILIEREIPKLLSFVIQVFSHSPDIYLALSQYEKVASPALKHEISMTLASMETGNYEGALLAMDARINSADFSKVVRALLAVLRGDDNVEYLRSLYREFDNKQIETLRLDSIKKPNQINKYNLLLLFCLLVICLAVFTLNIIDSLKVLF